jgi:hypothetical protein
MTAILLNDGEIGAGYAEKKSGLFNGRSWTQKKWPAVKNNPHPAEKRGNWAFADSPKPISCGPSSCLQKFSNKRLTLPPVPSYKAATEGRGVANNRRRSYVNSMCSWLRRRCYPKGEPVDFSSAA